MKKLLIIAVLTGSVFGQNYTYAPAASGWATNTYQNIPFGGTSTYTTGYTFMERIPASMMDPVFFRVDDIAMVAATTGTWSCANVHFGMGHIATPQPCPFTFPSITTGTVTSLGSFMDFTIMYSTAWAVGPFNWPVVADTWGPMNLPALGGSPFIWDGVNDVAFFITFQSSTPTWTAGGFRLVSTSPPSRTYISGFNMPTSSACNASSALYMRLQVSATPGLHAHFSATPVSGPAPRTVNFTDLSITSDPGGVLTWAWDVQNDGIDDYFTQNPTHVYSCPGTYSVKLTVTDGSNPPSTRLKTNYITVALNVFSLATSGGGVGDLTINPVPLFCFPAAVHGYTLVSFTTALGAVGTGPFAGIYPDSATLQFILSPPLAGSPVHFVVTGATYPNAGPFFLPPGTFSALSGVSMDAVEIGLTASGTIAVFSNAARVTF